MTEFRIIVDNQFEMQLLTPHSAFNVCLLLFCLALLSCSKGDRRRARRPCDSNPDHTCSLTII